jgi:hypothetical protein
MVIVHSSHKSQDMLSLDLPICPRRMQHAHTQHTSGNIEFKMHEVYDRSLAAIRIDVCNMKKMRLKKRLMTKADNNLRDVAWFRTMMSGMNDP